jgi:DNA-binding MarR family transcriptional regulator
MITKQNDLLGTLIHDVAHNLRVAIDNKLAPHNLTRVKWLALGIIRKNPGISQSGLAEKMELGNATVGRLIDRMVERGFVEREPDPQDRRAFGIFLTPEAKTLIEDLDHIAVEIRREALAEIPEEEARKVNKILVKMKKNLRTQLAVFTGFVFVTGHRVMVESEATLMSMPLI